MEKNLAQSAREQNELSKRMELLDRAGIVFLAEKWINIVKIQKILGYRFKK